MHLSDGRYPVRGELKMGSAPVTGWQSALHP
jgi:hypothetical protein